MKKRTWFRKGDRVKIVGNIPFQLKKSPRPLLGTVVHVDGAYVLVRPRYKRYTIDFLDNEVRHV